MGFKLQRVYPILTRSVKTIFCECLGHGFRLNRACRSRREARAIGSIVYPDIGLDNERLVDYNKCRQKKVTGWVKTCAGYTFR